MAGAIRSKEGVHLANANLKIEPVERATRTPGPPSPQPPVLINGSAKPGRLPGQVAVSLASRRGLVWPAAGLPVA